MTPPKSKPSRGNAAKGCGCLTGLAVLVIVVIILVVSHSSSTPPASSPSSPPAATAAASPAAAPTPHVLIRFDGSGIKNSAPFNVGSGPLTVKYSYNCASFGSAGNFVADLLYGNQSSLNSDDQPIANALAMSGSTTTTVYPQDPGKDYYLSVNSECSWRIKVRS